MTKKWAFAFAGAHGWNMRRSAVGEVGRVTSITDQTGAAVNEAPLICLPILSEQYLVNTTEVLSSQQAKALFRTPAPQDNRIVSRKSQCSSPNIPNKREKINLDVFCLTAPYMSDKLARYMNLIACCVP